ncbi:MAG: hypothetical protein QHH17_06205 [Candidatus Bathyarchaeota archaeon]|nr:hypothetical protein [Candidatus Bathyarchaeota archaeon]
MVFILDVCRRKMFKISLSMLPKAHQNWIGGEKMREEEEWEEGEEEEWEEEEW